jgi:hypothetical protein
MQQLPTLRPAIRPLANLALAAALAAMICAPGLALAQASPFLTGASSLQTNILAWLTPVAIILVMVLGGMAMANRLLRLFARRRRRDLCAVEAAAGVAEGGRRALHVQIRGARTPTGRANGLPGRLLSRRRRACAGASQRDQDRRHLGCRGACARASQGGSRWRDLARIAQNLRRAQVSNG